jgi:hypothetical protein
LLKEVVNSMTDVIEYLSKGSKDDGMKRDIIDIKNMLTALKATSIDDKKIEVAKKLYSIESFMTNLKLLLSQIKPSDMSVNKPSMSAPMGSPSTPPTSNGSAVSPPASAFKPIPPS